MNSRLLVVLLAVFPLWAQVRFTQGAEKISVEIDEAPGPHPDHSDICEAAVRAYEALVGFQTDHPTPYLLRVWNYLDAITQGDGDAERYREFCVGRARGLGRFDPSGLPAATAIGRCDGRRTLQVYWLSVNEAA